jgi:tetratricopeptide (TPR) repeat protein
MNEAASRSARTPRPAVALAAVLTVVVVTYVTSLDGTFVWDDRVLVLGDRTVTEGQPIADYFLRTFWQVAAMLDQARAYYRPLTALTYRLDYVLHGDNAAGFHVTNVVLHLIACALLFCAARRLKAAVLPAAALVLAWAVAPRLAENVAWISGRTDMLAGIGVFAAIALWPWPDEAGATARPAEGRLRAATAAAALAFGLFAKETALAAAAAIACVEVWLAVRRTGRSGIVARIVPLLAVVTIDLVLRGRALSGESIDDGLGGLLPRRPLVALTTIGTYVRLAFDPFRPLAYIGANDDVAAVDVALGALALAALAGLLVVAARRNDWAKMALLITGGLAVFVVSHLLPLPITVLVADRFLYIPAGMASVFVAISLSRSERLASGRRATMMAIAWAAWMAASIVFTRRRIDDWNDELRFWLTTGEATPVESPVAANELANILFREGYVDDACAFSAAYEERLRLAGKASTSLYRKAMVNVANCLSERGDYDGAIRIRRELVASRPDVAVYDFDAGLVELHRLDFVAARAAFERALALSPGYEQASTMLDRVDGAEHAFAELAAHEPVTTEERAERARWLARVGRRMDAERAFRDVLARDDATPQALQDAGGFMAEFGSLEAAKAAAERLADSPAPARAAEALRAMVERRSEFDRRVAAYRARIDGYKERLRQGAE